MENTQTEYDIQFTVSTGPAFSNVNNTHKSKSTGWLANPQHAQCKLHHDNTCGQYVYTSPSPHLRAHPDDAMRTATYNHDSTTNDVPSADWCTLFQPIHTHITDNGGFSRVSGCTCSLTPGFRPICEEIYLLLSLGIFTTIWLPITLHREDAQ